jgi:c-di-GMP-binding flagellar brake protein YcgR
MIERRNHPRVEVCHPVLYCNHAHTRPQVGSTVDLSLGGIRMETPHHLIPGDRLELSIAIRSRVIQCKGQVVHPQLQEGERLEAGVRFDELQEHDRHYLGQYAGHLLERRGKIPSSQSVQAG